MRRSQNLKKSPTCFDKTAFLLNSVKTSGRFFQIFVAFSEKLNFITENGIFSVFSNNHPCQYFMYLENRLFGLPKVQEAYNIINFRYLMENSILKIFGSMDVKITPDFCSKQLASCCKNYRHIFFREVS